LGGELIKKLNENEGDRVWERWKTSKREEEQKERRRMGTFAPMILSGAMLMDRSSCSFT
jgi:hypothetical protein